MNKGVPMQLTRKPMILRAASLLALTACSDPSQYPGTDGDRTRQGALAGAALGGLLGATRESGNDRFRNAVVGAAVGAAAGGLIGNAMDQQAAELRNDFGNGEIGNLGSHELDVCRWAMPVGAAPKSVVSLGGRFGY